LTTPTYAKQLGVIDVAENVADLHFSGLSVSLTVDGTNGWRLRPFLNRRDVESFTPEEKKVASLQSDLDGPLVDYAAKGTKVELQGPEKVEGKDTYKLKLAMKDGKVQHVWVDAQTFLEAKIEGAPPRLDGKYHPTAIYYRDYTLVNGVMAPHVVETTVAEIRHTEKIAIEKVAVNPKLDDARFGSSSAARGSLDQQYSKEVVQMSGDAA